MGASYVEILEVILEVMQEDVDQRAQGRARSMFFEGGRMIKIEKIFTDRRNCSLKHVVLMATREDTFCVKEMYKYLSRNIPSLRQGLTASLYLNSGGSLEK